MSTKKILRDSLRNRFLGDIATLFTSKEYEVLTTGSNEIAIPCTDDENNDEYIVITVKVPTGSRDGDAYDAYAVAEEYKRHCSEMEEKAKLAAAKKEAKIAKDKAEREAKAKAKAKHEAANTEG